VSIEAVLQKVRRLRALATSSNVHEAAAAAAAADRLIQEHRLSEAELESAGGPCEAIGEDATPLETFAGRVTQWKSLLGNVLAKHYGCASYLDQHGCTTTVRIIGRPSDIVAVRDMYAWLTLEIERLAAANARGRAGKNAYRLGAVMGISRGLRQSRATTPETKAPAGSTAMVLEARTAEADRWMTAAHKLGASTSKLSVSDLASFSRGRADGANIHLGASLPTGGPRALTA